MSLFCQISKNFKLAFLTKTLFFVISVIPAFASDFQYRISIFEDAKYNKNFQHFEYVNPNAPKKGNVRFGVEGGFNNLNQFILKGISASGLSYIYDSLMVSSDDEISAFYPLIATAVKLSDDKKSIEFLLNKKAVFHDGIKVTADDVVFTFNILVSKGHPAYKIAFRDVLKVVKINQYRVKFLFKHNKNRDLPFMIASLPVLPKHYYEKVDFEKTTLQPPLGSGPYKIKEIKPNNSITYERVKNYWAKDFAVNKGRYNFDKISYDYYRDNNILVEAFKSLKYDFRQENIARNWANSYDIEAVKDGRIIKTEIKHELPSPIQSFVFNLRKEKFHDINLRKAMTYAFDFEWLKKHIFYNSYERTESFFENSQFSYKGFDLPKSDYSGFNRKNLIIAKNILEDAGYKIIDGWLYDKNGKKIEVEFLIAQQSFEMVIAPFVRNLRKLGIDAKTRFVEENQYETRVNNFDYDIIVAVFSQSLIPGDELFAYFHSTQVNIKGSKNFIGLHDEKIDELVEKISQTKSRKTLIDLCQKLDKNLLENYYAILQWNNNSYRILYRDIFEMPKIKPKYSLAIDSWWIKD